MKTGRLTAPTKGRTFFRMAIAAAVSAVLIYGIVYVARMDIEGYADVSAYVTALAESASVSLAEELIVIGVPGSAMIAWLVKRLILLTASMAFVITAGFVITAAYDLAYFVWAIAAYDGSAGYGRFGIVNRAYAVMIHMITALIIVVSFSWTALIIGAVLCTGWTSYGTSGEFIVTAIVCAVYAAACIVVLTRWAVKKAGRVRAAEPDMCIENVGSYSKGLLMAVSPLLVFLGGALFIGLAALVITVRIALAALKNAPV